MIKIGLSIFWTASGSFETKLGLMAHHLYLDCLVKRLDCSGVVKIKVPEKVPEKVKIPVNVHLDKISSTVEPSVTKFGMVMRHQGPECHARRLVCCLQVQGYSEG